MRGRGDFGGDPSVEPQPPRWDLGPGWQRQGGGVGRAGHPLPLGALMPRGWSAGAAQPPGHPWGQRVTLGPDPARWPWQGQEWGQRQGDAIPRGQSILRHPRAGLAPHFGLLPPRHPAAMAAGPAPPCRGRKRRPAATDFGPIRCRQRRGRGRDFSCLPARWGLAPICCRGRALTKLGLASAQPRAAPYAGVGTLQWLI